MSTAQRRPQAAALARLTLGKHYRVHATDTDYLGNVGIVIGIPNRDLFEGFNDVWPPALFAKIRPADPEFISLIKRVPVGEDA